MISDKDIWQLIINTAATIITFLLVAFLQNAQRSQRDCARDQPNAIAEAIADLTEHQATGDAER